MKDTVRVTLQCLPSRTTSRTRFGQGYEVSYYLVTNLHVPGRPPLEVPNSRRDTCVIAGARRMSWVVPFSHSMSERLLGFVRISYIQNQLGFDCHSFAQYLTGAVQFPSENRNLAADGRWATDTKLSTGQTYVIARGNIILHALIGVSSRLALDVTGKNSSLCITEIGELMRAYGCNRLLRVDRYVQ